MLPEQNRIKLIELFRVCTKCKIPKTLKNFDRLKKGRFGVAAECKVCRRIYNKDYCVIHKEELKVRSQNYEKLHRKERKLYRESPKGKREHYFKTYRITHKKELKAYREKHKEKISSWKKMYQKAYKTKLKTYAKLAARERRMSPQYRLNNNISRAIALALNGNKNGRHWEDLVGYTLKDLKRHLEKLFITGMSWDKYLNSEIHIDHKIPKSAFNFTKPEHQDFKRCWALSNLQPMWAKENIIKSDKLDKHFQPSLLI